jgi:amidase
MLRKRVLSLLLTTCFVSPMLIASVQSAEVNVVELTVKDAHTALQNKSYTSKQLTEAFLARIAKFNPGYNAIITMNPDALKDAEEIDRRRAAGEALGPLAGIPVVVKDTMDFAGLPTTAGWAPLSKRAGGIELIPERDSPVVARMREAGAIILGKTNVPVLSLSGTNANDSWAGPTYNAADQKRATGGSSAGTATAVSGSFAVLGLAEETGGSIQNPAAAQALVSVKPTFALVPNTGVVPLATSTRDVVGPHAKTVYDAAITLDVLAGFTPDDPKTVASIGHMPKEGYTSKLSDAALQGKRIGLYGLGWRNMPLSPETQALYDKAIAQLEAQGAIVVRDPFAGSNFASLAQPSPIPGLGGYDPRGEDSVAFDLQNYLIRLGSKAPARTLAELTALIKQDPFADDGPLAYEKSQPGFEESLKDPSKPPKLKEFLAAREQYIQIFNQIMDEQKLDALVFPQMRQETPPLFSTDVIAETTVSEINIGGFPGVTVPAGYYPSGSPFGVIFVGRLWDEANLLGYAYDYEQATMLRKTPELVEKPTAENAPSK